jgi:chemotaxis protein methyltransferase CheR
MDEGACDVDLEVRLLLEAIHARYGHDFRGYSAESMRRRVLRAAARLGCATVSALQERVLHDPAAFPEVLDDLTIRVTDLFRDPHYFVAVRQQVVPLLAREPVVKIWIPGCASGEEVYSFAILLREEGLLDRAVLYATDIHAPALERARAGVFPLERMAAFSANYARAGGRGSLSDHYVAGTSGAVFHRSLRARIAFAEHSLATDGVFADVQMVSCRNVLIYFDRKLQDRAVRLFADALAPGGVLGLGARETIRLSEHGRLFEDLDRGARLFRRA